MIKTTKEGICKVSGRSVIFSAFYAYFCHCPKSVIITTLNPCYCFVSMFSVIFVKRDNSRDDINDFLILPLAMRPFQMESTLEVWRFAPRRANPFL